MIVLFIQSFIYSKCNVLKELLIQKDYLVKVAFSQNHYRFKVLFIQIIID